MITTMQMKIFEKKAVDSGATRLELMQRSGKGAFEVLDGEYHLLDKHIIIFSGHGNNGGDGFVLARHMQEAGIQTVVLFCGLEEKLSDEAKVSYDQIKEIIPIVQIDSSEEFELFSFQTGPKLLLIDSLLGTGAKGSIREPITKAIEYFNKTQGKKISLDIPTGINPDTGESGQEYCNSELIIAFHDIKTGLKNMRKKCIIVDIGLDKHVDEVKIEKV